MGYHHHFPRFAKNTIGHQKLKELTLSEHNSIGLRIAEARVAVGLTIEQAALRAAIAKSTLKSWESDRAAPRPNKLQLLAGVLGVSMTWLLTGQDKYDTISDAPNRLGKLEVKVARLGALQREVTELSNEIARDLENMRRIDEELDSLAA